MKKFYVPYATKKGYAVSYKVHTCEESAYEDGFTWMAEEGICYDNVDEISVIEVKVELDDNPYESLYIAVDDNYDGAPDSYSPLGVGYTEIEALESYIDRIS